MSVNCVDHFVSVTSWSLMCGCLVQVTCLSEKALFNFKKQCPLIYTVPFECEEASVPVCVGMCWHGSLMGDCSLISLRF